MPHPMGTRLVVEVDGYRYEWLRLERDTELSRWHARHLARQAEAEAREAARVFVTSHHGVRP